jgi:hypothetical protein
MLAMIQFDCVDRVMLVRLDLRQFLQHAFWQITLLEIKHEVIAQ